jgi:hypothetical protein
MRQEKLFTGERPLIRHPGSIITKDTSRHCRSCLGNEHSVTRSWRKGNKENILQIKYVHFCLRSLLFQRIPSIPGINFQWFFVLREAEGELPKQAQCVTAVERPVMEITAQKDIGFECANMPFAPPILSLNRGRGGHQKNTLTDKNTYKSNLVWLLLFTSYSDMLRRKETKKIPQLYM